MQHYAGFMKPAQCCIKLVFYLTCKVTLKCAIPVVCAYELISGYAVSNTTVYV